MRILQPNGAPTATTAATFLVAVKRVAVMVAALLVQAKEEGMKRQEKGRKKEYEKVRSICCFLMNQNSKFMEYFAYSSNMNPLCDNESMTTIVPNA